MVFIGWEWLNSGLTKIVRGNFTSGLPAQLHTQSEGAPSWYRDYIHDTVIPNAATFGPLIEIGEVAVGVALIGAAITWFWRGNRLADGGRSILLLTVAVAALAGTLMNVNFHIASGGHHPWLLAKDAFGEGVDLDSLLPMLQLTLAAVSGKLLFDMYRERRARTSKAPAGSSRRSSRTHPAATGAGSGIAPKL